MNGSFNLHATIHTNIVPDSVPYIVQVLLYSVFLSFLILLYIASLIIFCALWLYTIIAFSKFCSTFTKKNTTNTIVLYCYTLLYLIICYYYSLPHPNKATVRATRRPVRFFALPLARCPSLPPSESSLQGRWGFHGVQNGISMDFIIFFHYFAWMILHLYSSMIFPAINFHV